MDLTEKKEVLIGSNREKKKERDSGFGGRDYLWTENDAVLRSEMKREGNVKWELSSASKIKWWGLRSSGGDYL